MLSGRPICASIARRRRHCVPLDAERRCGSRDVSVCHEGGTQCLARRLAVPTTLKRLKRDAAQRCRKEIVLKGRGKKSYLAASNWSTSASSTSDRKGSNSLPVALAPAKKSRTWLADRNFRVLWH